MRCSFRFQNESLPTPLTNHRTGATDTQDGTTDVFTIQRDTVLTHRRTESTRLRTVRLMILPSVIQTAIHLTRIPARYVRTV